MAPAASSMVGAAYARTRTSDQHDWRMRSPTASLGRCAEAPPALAVHGMRSADAPDRCGRVPDPFLPVRNVINENRFKRKDSPPAAAARAQAAIRMAFQARHRFIVQKAALAFGLAESVAEELLHTDHNAGMINAFFRAKGPRRIFVYHLPAPGSAAAPAVPGAASLEAAGRLVVTDGTDAQPAAGGGAAAAPALSRSASNIPASAVGPAGSVATSAAGAAAGGAHSPAGLPPASQLKGRCVYFVKTLSLRDGEKPADLDPAVANDDQISFGVVPRDALQALHAVTMQVRAGGRRAGCRTHSANTRRPPRQLYKPVLMRRREWNKADADQVRAACAAGSDFSGVLTSFPA